MDLRSLPDGLSLLERIRERRKRIETELELDLSATETEFVGLADEKNCEQMFGVVHLPVGYAGPLKVTFISEETRMIHLPLATSEGALVASVNRGCKAITESGGARVESSHYGITRSIAIKLDATTRPQRSGSNPGPRQEYEISNRENEWKAVAEATSSHLKILRYDLDTEDDYLFLTIYADTDEAMGMNMVTIAAQAVGEWIEKNIDGCTFVTVAANVDSDKKPSQRTHDRGRGYEVIASATLDRKIIESILKSSPEAMAEVAHAKLDLGSMIAGAIGKNLHAANIIAALYLATGQDAAHVVEGSLADTTIELLENGLRISVRLRAILVGVRGGGTSLPSQSQCLAMLLGSSSGDQSRVGKPALQGIKLLSMHPKRQLAESIGAAVLAGEISLLAAQASHHLARAHRKLGR